jgi:hypothetical protein
MGGGSKLMSQEEPSAGGRGEAAYPPNGDRQAGINRSTSRFSQNPIDQSNECF